MTAKKRISRSSAGNNDGKKNTMENRFNSKNKNAVKYTIWRSKEDIEKLERVRKHLQSKYYYKSYKADSKIYKELPDLYLNAVKKCNDHQLAIDDLTAKLDQLEDLRASFCRIFELCEVDKQ